MSSSPVCSTWMSRSSHPQPDFLSQAFDRLIVEDMKKGIDHVQSA